MTLCSLAETSGVDNSNTPCLVLTQWERERKRERECERQTKRKKKDTGGTQRESKQKVLCGMCHFAGEQQYSGDRHGERQINVSDHWWNGVTKSQHFFWQFCQHHRHMFTANAFRGLRHIHFCCPPWPQHYTALKGHCEFSVCEKG